VITLPAPPIEALGGPDTSPADRREGNDGLAELVAKYPDRFVAFAAALPLNNVDASLRETERAIDQLGAKGVLIYTNMLGKSMDSPEFQPLFDEWARRDVPIWMHPARGASFPDYQTENRSQYEIWWTFGWPYETSAAMARFVFSGSSTVTRTSRSSRTTWAGWCRTSRDASATGGISSARARRTWTTRRC
jgi:aminocarboxymuconate-semialdehyde decarboxylase